MDFRLRDLYNRLKRSIDRIVRTEDVELILAWVRDQFDILFAKPTFYSGPTAPDNTIGRDGDSYLDTATSDFYVKINGVWVLQQNLGGGDETIAFLGL